MTRISWMAALAGITLLAQAGAVSADGPNAPASEELNAKSLKSPIGDGGNSNINGGDGSGTGTVTPGPGMTLKEGRNPIPTADPVSNGGNTAVNGGQGSGTGTVEPKGDR